MNANCDGYCAQVLPDLEIYAGETMPLNVKILDENGNALTYENLGIYNASLALMPYKVSYGLGANAVTVPPVLSKNGTMESSSSGELYAVFEMLADDTRYLSGKFTYQITIVRAGDVRISQGHMLIKQNIHQSF